MKLLSRDIHNHLLPGVDDGFRTVGTSLEAIGMLASEGVTELVFTPHMNPDVYPGCSEAQYRAVYEDFVKDIPPELGVRTHLASEYMVVKDFEERAGDPELLTYEDGSILIEMSYYYPSPNLEQAIFNLVMEGRKPILAHPERYQFIPEQGLKKLDHYVDMGCRLQLNYMSLTGAYGKNSVKVLRYLLDRGLYSFAATDLHSVGQLRTLLDAGPAGHFLKRSFYRQFPELKQ